MTTEDRDSGNGLGGVVFAFIAGAAVGAATALMLAPASGRETRARVQGAARDAAEKARRGVQEVKGTVGESWQRAVNAAKDAFEAALQRD